MGVGYFVCDGDCGEIMSDAGHYVTLFIDKDGKDYSDLRFCENCADDKKDSCIPSVSTKVIFNFEWKRPTTLDFISLFPKDISSIIIDYYAPLSSYKTLNRINYNTWCKLFKWIYRSTQCEAIILDINKKYNKSSILRLWNNLLPELRQKTISATLAKICQPWQKVDTEKGTYIISSLSNPNIFLDNFISLIKRDNDECEYWFKQPSNIEEKYTNVIEELKDLEQKKIKLQKELEELRSSNDIMFSRWHSTNSSNTAISKNTTNRKRKRQFNDGDDE